jgi:putative photosynthetic complex assembly protein
MSEIDKEPFPKFALYGAAVIIVLAITAAAVGRHYNIKNAEAFSAIQEPVETYVDLQFTDRADGSVIVTNAATSEVILNMLPTEDAFIRAVLRGFVRDRAARKLGKDQPFRLYRLVDSRLIIEDTATKKRINLRGFGPTQQAAFARLLPASPEK